ncbi:hypothetical protein [Aneurinibacillus tyrosinisolvens]|uniref:hypothetical protein n=1 Tax=Aneurinibacillus tyrosinisolvens TaxID=1443435 RepID=UPI000ADEEEC1|nr:hypothetical protein [Aneurinibacillus tyrosinisolvens]
MLDKVTYKTIVTNRYGSDEGKSNHTGLQFREGCLRLEAFSATVDERRPGGLVENTQRLSLVTGF